MAPTNPDRGTGTPAAEIAIDDALVRALLKSQHPDLAGLPVTAVGEGWDNAIYRLSETLAMRLPRRALAARLIEHEQRWLPELAERCPCRFPRRFESARRKDTTPGGGAWFRGSRAIPRTRRPCALWKARRSAPF